MHASIERGLDYIRNHVDSNGWAMRDANSWPTGMCSLALMEKRAGADWSAPPLGYVGSSEADKTRLRNAAIKMIQTTWAQGFYAYGYGQVAMALTTYRATGGPNDLGLSAGKSVDDTLNRLATVTQSNQNASGAWDYWGGTRKDNSTTQFAAAGLGSLATLVPDATTKTNAFGKLRTYLTTYQNADGGYGYNWGSSSSHQQSSTGLWL